MMGFLTMLDATLIFVLLMFNGWNWFLAYYGLTSLEFFGQVTGNKSNCYDYSFETINDNMFKVFGTQSYA